MENKVDRIMRNSTMDKLSMSSLKNSIRRQHSPESELASTKKKINNPNQSYRQSVELPRLKRISIENNQSRSPKNTKSCNQRNQQSQRYGQDLQNMNQKKMVYESPKQTGVGISPNKNINSLRQTSTTFVSKGGSVVVNDRLHHLLRKKQGYYTKGRKLIFLQINSFYFQMRLKNLNK